MTSMTTTETDKPQRARLTVTDCTVAYRGKNRRGDDYTIYEIKAFNAKGPIEFPLRSFTELPTGREIEVTVKKFKSDDYGDSYTLSPQPGHSKRDIEIAELRERVTALEERLNRLEPNP